MLKSTVLPQAEAKGSTWNMSASQVLRFRQYYRFLMLQIFVQKPFFFGKQLIKTSEIDINAEL